MIIVLLALMQPIYGASSPPKMVLPGGFSLSPTGAAVYSVPIEVPPGTAGMRPALALTYSSQSGRGMVGLGWTLGGLPTIERCPRTVSQDGIHGSVNFDNNDRYCLQGQRLVAVSGSYGSDGTEYRTAIESFSKVISYGSAGSGPSYFKVWTKSGQILEFGNSSDSRVLAVGKTTVRTWTVNKASDRKGNYYTVTYTTDASNGQFYPTRIDYTGNAAASLLPYNSVQFGYTNDAAGIRSYQAGSLQRTTVLLSSISTYQGANLVLRYNLGYSGTANGLAVPHLISLTQCAADGSCLPATAFGWQGGDGQQPTYSLVADDTVEPAASVQSGDFNGDGLTDVFVGRYSGGCTNNESIFYGAPNQTFYHSWMTKTENGATTSACFVPPGGVYPGPALLDFAGNGFTGIETGGVSLVNGKSGNFTAIGGAQGLIVGDFNGDGRSDLLESGYFHIGNGDGTFNTSSTSISWNLISNPVPPGCTDPGCYRFYYDHMPFVADFDGDGCSDIAWMGQVLYSCNPAVGSINHGVGTLIGDFNGDGKADYLDLPKVYLSTGTGFTSGYDIPSAMYANCSSNQQIPPNYIGDFNADGRDDVACTGTSSITIWYSSARQSDIDQGASFVQGPTITIPGATLGSMTIIPGDWNSDGGADLWVRQNFHGYLLCFSSTPTVMVSVSNGIGATTSISYSRLNMMFGSYGKGSDAIYPYKDYNGARYVVSSVSFSDGNGGSQGTGYWYSGAKQNSAGLGFVGFSLITSMSSSGLAKGEYYCLGQNDAHCAGTASLGLLWKQTLGMGPTDVDRISTLTNTYLDVSLGASVEGVARHFVALTRVETEGADFNFSNGQQYALPTAQTNYHYDCQDSQTACYGNLVTTNTSSSDNSTGSVTNTYANDATSWIVGLPTRKQTTTTVGTSSITRTACFQYDGSLTGPFAFGLLTREVAEPITTSNCTNSSTGVQTDYAYDTFGNRTQSTVSALDIGSTRSSTFTYDSRGEFLAQACNAEGHCETWNYSQQVNQNFGVPFSHTGPNNQTTTWSYDSFGRSILEVRPDNTRIASSYSYCSGVNLGTDSCASHGAFLTISTPQNTSGAQNGPKKIAYFDSMLRVIATDVQGFDGPGAACSACWIRTETLYDSLGRLQKTSRPYFISNGTVQWTSFTYDPLNRVTRTDLPNGGYTTASYQGLTSVVTDHVYNAKTATWSTQVKTTVKNAQGLVASVTDNLGHTMSYVYDAVGNLTSATDPAQNSVSNRFDPTGRFKTDSYDPDMGHWTYAYDALGELVQQTDAKGQTTTLKWQRPSDLVWLPAYDRLGRLFQRIEPSSSGSVYSNWRYDFGTGAIGKLSATCTSGASNLDCTASTASKSVYTYDAVGRSLTTTISTGASNHTYSSSYDPVNGWIATVSYPSGFVAKYIRTSAFGYVCQIVDGASTNTDCAGTNLVYWKAVSRDAELHALTQTFGNGVGQVNGYDAATGLPMTIWATKTANGDIAQLDYRLSNGAIAYDTAGNLLHRQDGLLGTFEDYCYDGLNRLTEYAAGNAVTACTSSANHKLIQYDSAGIGNITAKTGVGTYIYPGSGGGTGSRPHAIASITGTVNGVVNPNYHYDANGNLDCVYTGSYPTNCQVSGASRKIAWTAFNMVDTVSQGATSVSYTYDSAHQRQTQTLTVNGTATTTAYLSDPASGAMSEKVISGSTTTWSDYLLADGHFVAERFCTGATPCTSGATMKYFITDHLGSVAVVMDSAGNPANAQHLAYDPWGRRRNADGSDFACGTNPASTTRGFTGHEEVDSVCLINANARMYDPTVGRFMSPDSIVAMPFSSQGFNRYAYVENNPLSATDPTGHECDGKSPDGASCSAIAASKATIRALQDAYMKCSENCGPLARALAEARSTGAVAVSTLAEMQTFGYTAVFDVGGREVTGLGALANALFGPSDTNNGGFQNANWSSSDGTNNADNRGGLQFAQYGGNTQLKSYTPVTHSKTIDGAGRFITHSGTGEFRITIVSGRGYYTRLVNGVPVLAADQVQISLIYLDKPNTGGPDYMYGTPTIFQNNTVDKIDLVTERGLTVDLQGRNGGGNYEVLVTPYITTGRVSVNISTTE
jgi:RHS repeat-associated protein